VSYLIGRKLIQVPYIGMANLILGKEVFPEFIQHAATFEAMAAQGQSWLDHPGHLEQIRRELEVLPEMMGTGRPTHRAAEIIMEYVI
jgi:lipid-A-disaccharide synthase